jgi:hypothetical protein
MSILSQIWFMVQTTLFPYMDKELGPLSDNQRKLVAILELSRIEEYIPRIYWNRGRPAADRCALARSFVAKMVYNFSTTIVLIDQIKSSPVLRRICGWERVSEIPSESTFSRAFYEFSETELPQRVHEALIDKYESERIVGHISRDSTDIQGREKTSPKPKETSEGKPKRKRGRPKKGEKSPPKEPTRLEKQSNMTLDEMLDELPSCCDWGTKKKNGKTYHWKGFKLHVDWADGEIPISAILTSASVHDSQAAIPLATMSAARVDNLYDLMDAAYDAKQIKEHSSSLGHIPIIDANPRKGKKIEMDPATKRRYDERSTAERGFSLFKECFGGRSVRVRGDKKVMAHIMFGIVALTADRLLNLLI